MGRREEFNCYCRLPEQADEMTLHFTTYAQLDTTRTEVRVFAIEPFRAIIDLRNPLPDRDG